MIIRFWGASRVTRLLILSWLAGKISYDNDDTGIPDNVVFSHLICSILPSPKTHQ